VIRAVLPAFTVNRDDIAPLQLPVADVLPVKHAGAGVLVELVVEEVLLVVVVVPPLKYISKKFVQVPVD
jgi:hypothetical protein